VDLGHKSRLLPSLATVLIVAFTAVSLTTAASHCLEACTNCTEDHLEEISKASETSLHIEGSAPASSEKCPGAICLCHHHPLVTGKYEVMAFITATEHREAAPATPTIGVVREILHIPKRLS
jgi:hypothetical protein